MVEIVYVLTNEAMPGYVKVGRTSTSLEQRIRELSTSSSVPIPFTCFYACTVQDSAHVERQLHRGFGDNRANPKREFFQIAPERIVDILKLVALEDITPRTDIVDSVEDQAALNEAREERRSRFNFERARIPLGSEIYFGRDETIKAIVADPHFILLNGKQKSLSKSAQEILGYNYGVAGTDYWKYDGETLDERRRRLESDNST